MAVKTSTRRQLVLTHTFAGVNSIKTKMSALGVPSSKYHIETIASWSLRLCLAYPKTSGWKIENPTSKQWAKLYECCSELLAKEFIRHVVKSTYAGVYVDEYQDCSYPQHALVCALAKFLPSRILGDPMQAIFDFDDGKPVDWGASVYPNFNCLGQLQTPWRWENAGEPKLGAWLNAARESLEQGKKIDLVNGLPASVKWVHTDAQYLANKQYSSLCGLLGNNASVIALHGGDQKSKNKTHLLARTMAGRFSSIEEVEGKDLFAFVKKLNAAKTAKDRFLLVLEFSKKCFTAVDKALSAGTRLGNIAKETKATKYPLLLEAANQYLTAPTSNNLKEFILQLKANPET
jgi:DNA helicase-2/ATP-dependent DNA helicase PcrA